MNNLTKKLVEREVEVTKTELKMVPVYLDKETGREYSEQGLKVKILHQILSDGDSALNDIASNHCCKTAAKTLLNRTDGQDYLQIYKAIEPHIALLKETGLI